MKKNSVLKTGRSTSSRGAKLGKMAKTKQTFRGGRGGSASNRLYVQRRSR